MQKQSVLSRSLTANNLSLYVCRSVSLESSVMGHDEMLQVMKEKMRLEGQLESLSSEASQVKTASCFLTHWLSLLTVYEIDTRVS